MTGSVHLDQGFFAKGQVSFASAKVDRDLNFRGAEFIGSLYANNSGIRDFNCF